MNKFIAYYRVSTKQQNLGIDAQKKVVSDYISNTVNSTIIAEYVEKESGKNDDRLELYKALDHCKKNNYTLIIAKLDRLSRNVSFIFSLKDSGTPFVCCDIPECNTMTLGIFATLAQTERELISLRTKEALREKSKSIKLGNPSNLINNIDKAIHNSRQTRMNKAVNNANNRKAFSMITSLRANGENWSNIARILNKYGFKTSNNSMFYAKTVQNVVSIFNKYENITK